MLEDKQVRRREVVVQDGDDRQDRTDRASYANYRIGEIRAAKDNQLLEVKLPGRETFLQPGRAVGEVDADAMKRLMIPRTIHEHLEKEKRLAPLGIKVLSLFFIDAVEHYRSIRRKSCEGQVRSHFRGTVSPSVQASRASQPI